MANVSTSAPVYASAVLRQLSDLSSAATVVPIHSYLPIPPLTLLHAVIVSHNSLLISGYFTHNKGKLNLATSILFNQLLLFGPLSVLAAMLAQPCPVLIAPEFIYIYAAVHVVNVLSGLGATLVSLSRKSGTGILIDTIAAVVDAFARIDGIALLGVEVVRHHPNAIVAASPFAALLIGTGVGVGSLLMLGLISFEKTEWTLRTPTWIRTPSLLLGTDYLSSVLATFAYYVFTSPNGLGALAYPASAAPVLHAMRPYILPVMPYAASLSSTLLHTLQVRPAKTGTVKAGQANGPLLSSAEARVLGAAIVFAFSFGNRLKRALLTTVSSTGPIPKAANSNNVKTAVVKDTQNGDVAVVKASVGKSAGAKKRK